MEELTNIHIVAIWGFCVAAVFGFFANKTHFCAMGAVSDALHMGSRGRLAAWMLAMGISILGTQGLVLAGLIDLGESIYLTANFMWLGHLLGGLAFGIGMTLAAGCGQRNLVRFGAGNLKALVVLLVLGVTAYMTLRGLLGVVRINVFDPTNVDLTAHGMNDQSLVTMLANLAGMEAGSGVRAVVSLVAGGGLVAYALLQSSLRESLDNVLAGVVIGGCVVMAWFITGNLGVDDFDPVPVESMSFISPVGNSVNYLMTYTGATINFGIALVGGMIFGSFVYAIVSRSFRIETFSNRSEMTSHLAGAVLMGFGGVLSLGCTIGQGVTGLSTLAAGSLISLLAIIFGAALTMKVQYHLLDEKGIASALGAALADLLIPGRGEAV